jgi:HK97 family phage major capsid protein
MLGVTNSPCSIVHAKDGGQTGSTVSYTNLSGMVSRLLPSSWERAAWVLHPSTLTALFGVYLATGASGGIPLPLSQGADGTYRLFGKPMIVSDFAAPLSSQGDIALVDLSFFAVGFREDLRFEVSRDHLFSSDEVSYRVVQRRDGSSVLPSAVTPARGATTLSPFVVLAAR